MIDSLKPYSAYKDSCIPWLGKVPEHWELRRLDRFFTLRMEPPLVGDQRVTAYLDGRVTLRSNVVGQKIKGVVKEAGWQRVHPGDFAISGMNAHLGGMGVSDSLGKCSPIYLVLKPKRGTNAQFVSRAVRHTAHSGALKGLVNTIRFNSADFKRDDLKRIRVWQPSEDEQSAIVRFLDYTSRRIRRYIRAKQKLIALLNEQKQTIIHRAVTRGLDPNIRLKPSGVEWLGDVPAHWDVVPNRALFRPKKELVGSDSGDYTLLSLTKRGVIPRDLENPEGKFPTSFDSYQIVHPGDIIFCLFDIDETPRAVGLATMAGMVTGAYTRFACEDPAAVEFIYLFYLAMDNDKRLKPLYTGLRKVITKSTFLSAKTPLPPTPERHKLVEHIRKSTSLANKAIEHAQREISLLSEFRTRLIADVVTGKLDVREAAAWLPERAEGSESLDEAETLPDGHEQGEGPELNTAPEEAEA